MLVQPLLVHVVVLLTAWDRADERPCSTRRLRAFALRLRCGDHDGLGREGRDRRREGWEGWEGRGGRRRRSRDRQVGERGEAGVGSACPLGILQRCGGTARGRLRRYGLQLAILLLRLRLRLPLILLLSLLLLFRCLTLTLHAVPSLPLLLL